MTDTMATTHTYEVWVTLLDWAKARNLAVDADPRFLRGSEPKEATAQTFKTAWEQDDPDLYTERSETFTVEAADANEAAEIAFAITNSYPEEMWCDAQHADIVAAYRAANHRSLSVGDVVHVIPADIPSTGKRLGCANVGFVEF